MRIISGRFKGRILSSPRSTEIRPTSDRVRESLFNILEHHSDFELSGCRVLDLFAGSGALGCEALSRGASFALFMDNSPEGRAICRENIEKLNLGGSVKLSKRDATNPGTLDKGASYNLVFADPPYGEGLGEQALKACGENGWISPHALVILEERSDITPNLPNHFTHLKDHKFSETTLHFYRYDS